MGQKICNFQKEIMKTKKIDLNYWLYLPKDYEKENNQNYPLVLFLHGAGERGDDLDLVKKHGIPKLADSKDFPFILLSPQCPSYSNWIMEMDGVMELLEDTMKNYHVDESRVYLTGLSMGGYGTWEISTHYANKFAAIAPICGGGVPEKAHLLKDIPVWAFHGAKDNVVPLEESEKMVKALEECGGNAKLTIYAEADHDSWTETYNNQDFYNWLLSYKKSKVEQ